MITNFEEITAELTSEELQVLPKLMEGFENHSIHDPIIATVLVGKMNSYLKMNNNPIKMTDVRLRKMVNFIRTNGLLPLIATSKGYYVTYNEGEIQKQIDSLEQRSNSIARAALGLRKVLEMIKSKK